MSKSLIKRMIEEETKKCIDDGYLPDEINEKEIKARVLEKLMGDEE